MTAKAELAALLARAAAAGVSRPVVRPASPEGALGTVIGAIRDTILPREMTFRTQDGPRLTAAASGGCLLSLTDIATAAPADPIDRPLTAQDPEEVAAVAQVLQRLFSTADEISIVSAPPRASPDPIHSGIPADALLRQLGLATFAVAVDDPLTYFRDAAEDVLLAVQSPREAPRLLRHSAPVPDELTSAVQQMLTDTSGPLTGLGPGEMLFLLPPQDCPVAVGLTHTGDGAIALMFDADALAELAAYWSAMPHVTVSFET